MTDEKDNWLHQLKENARLSQANWWTTFWLSLFLGYFGVDRFYPQFSRAWPRKNFALSAGLACGGSPISFCSLPTGMHDDNGGIVKRTTL